MSNEIQVPVLWLDLDGTVRHGKDELGRFVNGPEDVKVFPEAVTLMRRWREKGGRIVGISNQGGIALGIVSFAKVIEAVIETHRQSDELFDKISFCRHHPDAKDMAMARCWCRKPRAGLIIDAARTLNDLYPDEIYPPHLGLFVGDRAEDKVCAEAANLDFQWAKDWRATA